MLQRAANAVTRSRQPFLHLAALPAQLVAVW